MNKVSVFLILVYFVTTDITQAQTFSSNRTPVGMEHNVLFDAESRFVVEQIPANSINASPLFDGKYSPVIVPASPTNPFTLHIKNLPSIHVQAGGWVGWSSRYRYPKRFEVWGYETHQNPDQWVLIADYSSTDYTDLQFSMEIPTGNYTELKFIFQESSNPNLGTIQLTEVFFIHPEATTPYAGLFDGSGSSVWTLNNGDANFQGNIGIGTSSPTAPVHIDQDGPEGLLLSRAGHDQYTLAVQGSKGLYIKNRTDARNEMVFLGNGNIGVGTDSPSELFTIHQGTAASGLSIQRDGYDDYNLSLQGGKGLIIRNNTDSRNEMVFNGTGRVGIGTDNPAKELEVAGDLVVGKSGQSGKIHFRRSLDGGIRGFVGFTSGTNYQDIKICNETGGGWLTFLTNDGTSTQERMRVNGNGNIGIGTSAPTQKLSVNGKINAEEIILEDVAGADFVFEEDYDLRTLEETEEFIKVNKHLPEVPSAAEMAEEGLELKAMNILLLQKVEELTLHLIRQEKEMKQQKQQFQQMQDQIQELQTAQNND